MKINDYKWIYFIAILLLYISFANNYVGGNADDSVYIVLGESLVNGNGYRIISSPGNYINKEFPPLFPLIIGGIFLFGGNLFAIKLFIAILGVISIYLLYIFLKLFFREREAFLISVLTGIAPLFVLYTHQVMSEVPYFLFSILALYYFVLYINKKSLSKKYLFLCSFFILLSYFTRTIGFVLVGAMGLFLAFEKFDKRNVKKFIFIILIIMIPVFLWSLKILINEGGVYEKNSYKDFFLKSDLYDVNSDNLDLMGVINRLGYNGMKQVSQFSKTIFHPINWLSLFYPNLKIVEFPLILLVFLIILIGFMFSLINKRTVIEYYFAMYIFFIFLIPSPSSRYLFPVIPFIIIYFIVGIKWLLKNISNKKIILNLIILLIIISSLMGVSKQIYFEHTGNYYTNVWGENKKGLVDMAFWARENIPQKDNIIVYNPSTFYLLSGIKGDSPLHSYNKTEVLNQIYKKNAEYVVIDKGFGKKYLDPVITEDRFEEVYENDGNKIYKINR